MGETRAVRRIGALAAALTALLGGAAMAADIGVSLRFAKVDGDERFDPLTVFDSLGRPDLFLCFNQNGAAADGWRCLPDEIRARDAVVVPATLPCANALSCVFRDVAVWPDAPFAFELRDADIDESEVIERGICTLTGGALRCREEIGNATLSLVTDLETYAPLATARAPRATPEAASRPAAPAPAATAPAEPVTETATATAAPAPEAAAEAAETPTPDPDAPPQNGVIAAAQTPMLPTLMAAVPVSLDTLRPATAAENQAEVEAAPAEATEDADLGFTVVAAEPLAAEPPMAAAEPVSLSAPAAETLAEAAAAPAAETPVPAEPAQSASHVETAPTPPALVTTSVPASIAIDAAQSGFAALVADLAALHRAATGEARFGFCRDPETALSRAIEVAALPALHALAMDPDVGWRVAHRLAQSLIADADPAAVAAAEAALAADFNAEPQLFEAALTGRDRAAPLLSAEAAKEIFGAHCG